MRVGLLVLSALLVACGYHPVDASRVFGPEVRRIAIRAFVNESQEVGLERDRALPVDAVDLSRTP